MYTIFSNQTHNTTHTTIITSNTHTAQHITTQACGYLLAVISVVNLHNFTKASGSCAAAIRCVLSNHASVPAIVAFVTCLTNPKHVGIILHNKRKQKSPVAMVEYCTVAYTRHWHFTLHASHFLHWVHTEKTESYEKVRVLSAWLLLYSVDLLICVLCFVVVRLWYGILFTTV